MSTRYRIHWNLWRLPMRHLTSLEELYAVSQVLRPLPNFCILPTIAPTGPYDEIRDLMKLSNFPEVHIATTTVDCRATSTQSSVLIRLPIEIVNDLVGACSTLPQNFPPFLVPLDIQT